jgi:hypothetical protein
MAITPENTATEFANNVSANTLDLSLTVTAADCLIAAPSCNVSSGGLGAASVVWDPDGLAETFTLVSGASSIKGSGLRDNQVEYWVRVNPTPNTSVVRITFNANTRRAGSVEGYIGVDQSTPIVQGQNQDGNSGTATSLSAFTGVGAGDLALTAFAGDDAANDVPPSLAINGSGVEVFNADVGRYIHAFGREQGVTTTGWTWGSAPVNGWAAIAALLKEESTPPSAMAGTLGLIGVGI